MSESIRDAERLGQPVTAIESSESEYNRQPIGVEDFPWMRKAGWVLPETNQQDAWLASINGLAANGNRRIHKSSSSQEKESINAARGEFLELFGRLNADALLRGYDAQEKHGRPMPHRLVDSYRYAHMVGVDLTGIISAFPNWAHHNAKVLRQRIEQANRLGVDAVALYLREPRLIMLGPQAMRRKFASLRAAAHVLGATDRQEAVNKIVLENPVILEGNIGRAHLLLSIGKNIEGMEPVRDLYTPSFSKLVSPLYIYPAASLAVAYLLGGSDIHSVRKLRTMARYYTERFDRLTMEGIILEHLDDPVAQLYCNYWPIADPAAATRAWDRYEAPDSDWAGSREILGPPELTAFAAFRRALGILEPDATLERSQTILDEKAKEILLGIEADDKLRHEENYIFSEVVQIDSDDSGDNIHTLRLWQREAKTLMYAVMQPYLAQITGMIATRGGTAEAREEMMGIANVTLTQAVVDYISTHTEQSTQQSFHKFVGGRLEAALVGYVRIKRTVSQGY